MRRARAGLVRQVHDPCIIKEGDTYHLFCTGPRILWRTSRDLENWELRGNVFSAFPAWAREAIPRADSLWAPDISYYNGRFHLYYAVSTFGSNRSCIGLATNATLDSQLPDYQWVDEGKVIESNLTDDWNAIDPNLILDEDGQPWLAWGSFWTGIKMRRVEPGTGKLSSDDTRLYSLARRDLVPGTSGAIEAPFLIRRQGYYYLFVSFDFCCKGALSTYKIMVGRAEKVIGPYYDRDGQAMLEGGGTLVLEGDDRWRGPGHNAVLQEPGGDLLVFHAYDAKAAGMPTLRISPITWDAEGWPHASL
ncbi:MAG: arabinan endo-1,5-alpha-L-arabinosidase [Anaerolineae bacterium]|nr:arabinan endo-1,5-alpha-L-arabinosidase [Anaerolineae bacterium]